jgi:sRNA-binding carbon storage regulator CsrA
MWSRKLHLRRNEEIVAHVGTAISIHISRGADGDYRVGVKAPQNVPIAFEQDPKPIRVAKPG